jgi:sigma-B regulation protein RsbU (phosphoserine phosphatase)
LVDIDALKKQVEQLRKEKKAFQAQCDIFQEFITMARSPEESEFVKSTLKKIVEISRDLTQAKMASLFLLDSDGVVVDSVLARGKVAPEVGSALIGSVFKKGLAGWVARNRKIGLVEDTNQDKRWLVLPNQPYSIRSVLALPIVSGELLLGILTLMHPQPGHFKPEMAAQMKMTAAQLALVLENAYLFSKLQDSYTSLGIAKQKIEQYSSALEQELERGRRIQKDFLPRRLPNDPQWEIQAFFQPARQVSGDFYDVFELPGGHLGLVVGDVCDKGVGSALFMALIRSLLRVFSGQAHLDGADEKAKTPEDKNSLTARKTYEASDAVRSVALTNDYLTREHGEMSMFATVFFAVLDPENGEMIYINGGHETVFIIDANGVKERLRQTGPAVGLFPEARFDYQRTQLAPGDNMFAFTDGVSEACSKTGDFFTRERLDALLSKPGDRLSHLLERVKSEIFSHVDGAPLEDDITILTLRRLSTPSAT